MYGQLTKSTFFRCAVTYPKRPSLVEHDSECVRNNCSGSLISPSNQVYRPKQHPD